MARSVEKDFELTFGGFCGDYEGNCGHFTVRVPLKVWSNGRGIRIESEEAKIEWIQKDMYAPTVSLEHSCCGESK